MNHTDNEHWHHTDELPVDVTKPTEGPQLASEGRDCLQIAVGALLVVALVIASVTGHAAVSAQYLP